MHMVHFLLFSRQSQLFEDKTATLRSEVYIIKCSTITLIVPLDIVLLGGLKNAQTLTVFKDKGDAL